jgi:stage II sporulation protein AA (anti-sigma F factor antagonist)
MEGVMELRTERVESAVILHLDGRLTVETGAGWLRDAGRAVRGHGVRHVLIDMGKVSQIDCSGIGQLLQFRQQAHEARRTLALVDVGRRPKRVLEMSGLLHVFRVFGGCEEAALVLGLGSRRVLFPPAEAIAAWPGIVRGRLVSCLGAADALVDTECLS